MLRVPSSRALGTAFALALLPSTQVDAQVPASANTELPAITVTTDPDDYAPPAKQRAKAPAAAQQSSTPPSSSDGKPDNTARGTDNSDVSVSPTGIAEPVDQIGSSVTVITSKEIQAHQRRTLPDVLKSVPGLNVVQSNGPGGQTSVFMRGTNSNHTKVLIDGIDVSDPSNPNRSFDFGQMLTSDIERVEVLRGPQSGLYGADAIGGVILIYTKKGSGPPKVNTMIEGGSFGTFNQATSISGGTNKYNYSVNVSHFRADDTPVTPYYYFLPGEQRLDNSYDNWTYSAKLGVDLSKDFTVNLVTRYTDSALRFVGDDYSTFPSHAQSERSRSDVDNFFTRGEVVWKTLGGTLTNYFGINYANLQTTNFDPSSGTSLNEGDRVKYDWRSVLRIAPGYTIVTGADHQNEQLNTRALFAEEWNNGIFAELQSEIFHDFFLVANVRYDDNENFGGHTTWRVAPAYVIEATGTKLKASVGTGFKAPTLSQRFQDFPPYFVGNPDLNPEESIGMDAGFEQAIFNGQARFGATYFYNNITNLIDSNATFTSYINVGKARTSGVEAFVSADLTDDLRVRTDYTYTEATDEDTHTQLLRRPRNKGTISAGWTPYKPLLLTASVVLIGESADLDRATSVSPVELLGFGLVNVAADYKLNDRMALFGRIDNLFDKHYENPNGFLGTGMGVYGGIRFTN
jgi:vitamin B12 transporter